MAKELNMVIDNCLECPYCRKDNDNENVNDYLYCGHPWIQGSKFIAEENTPVTSVLKNCPLHDKEGGLGC
jgi:hypothetical protein